MLQATKYLKGSEFEPGNYLRGKPTSFRRNARESDRWQASKKCCSDMKHAKDERQQCWLSVTSIVSTQVSNGKTIRHTDQRRNNFSRRALTPTNLQSSCFMLADRAKTLPSKSSTESWSSASKKVLKPYSPTLVPLQTFTTDVESFSTCTVFLSSIEYIWANSHRDVVS